MATETDYRAKRKAGSAALGRLMKPVRRRLLIARLVTLASCCMALAPYVALTRIGRLLLADGPTDEAAIAHAVSLLLCAVGTQVGLYFLALLIAHRADIVLRDRIQRDMIDTLATAPLAWYSASTSGRIRKAIQDDAAAIHSLIAHAPVDQTAVIVTPVVLVGYSFTIDWRLGLLSFVTFPVFLAGQAYCMRDMGPKTAQMDDKLADLSSATVELVDGIHVVKNFGRTGRAHRRFTDACRAFADFYWDWCGPLMRVSSLSMGFISVAVLMGIMLGGGLTMAHLGWVGVPEVLVCSLIALVVPRAIMVSASMGWAYQQAGNAALHLLEVLDIERVDYPDPGDIPDGNDVVFDDVSYSYRVGEVATPALKGVSLRLEEGTVTALVGPSGSGKSTLATMLARFRDPDQGAIRIGGVDLRRMGERELYRRVAFVLQNPYLQRVSVRDAIALARPDADIDTIREAAAAARIIDDIDALPNGFDTIIGGDTDFSGGQKQRIAIARALVADAPILVLDEATAGTDPDCEADIQAALAELVRDRTVLVIAHHAEAIRGVDKIVIMEDGHIVAAGGLQDVADHPYWVSLAGRNDQ